MRRAAVAPGPKSPLRAATCREALPARRTDVASGGVREGSHLGARSDSAPAAPAPDRVRGDPTLAAGLQVPYGVLRGQRPGAPPRTAPPAPVTRAEGEGAPLPRADRRAGVPVGTGRVVGSAVAGGCRGHEHMMTCLAVGVQPTMIRGLSPLRSPWP